MKLTIDITDGMYQAVKNGTWCGGELWYNALKNGIPQETVTEFADRCKECGAHYGRLLNQKWTPVSEGLPKKENDKEDRYLTTILNEYDNSLRYVMTCYFINGCWCPDDECASNNVVAWMPLPEPYKEEGSKE